QESSPSPFFPPGSSRTSPCAWFTLKNVKSRRALASARGFLARRRQSSRCRCVAIAIDLLETGSPRGADQLVGRIDDPSHPNPTDTTRTKMEAGFPFFFWSGRLKRRGGRGGSPSAPGTRGGDCPSPES